MGVWFIRLISASSPVNETRRKILQYMVIQSWPARVVTVRYFSLFFFVLLRIFIVAIRRALKPCAQQPLHSCQALPSRRHCILTAMALFPRPLVRLMSIGLMFWCSESVVALSRPMKVRVEVVPITSLLLAPSRCFPVASIQVT
jgi:hypothetical protein